MAGNKDNGLLVETWRGKGITALLAVLLYTLYSPPGHAQWEVIYPSSSTRASGPIAQITNSAGHRVQVYRHDNNHVYAMFRIQERFDTFHKGACPTYMVDGKLSSGTDVSRVSCELKARDAVFDLGVIATQRLNSGALLQWMNGSKLTFRYHLQTVGYRETHFSLKSSSRAVATVLGTGVRVVAE